MKKCDPTGARTQDPYIKSVLLYQLSYRVIIFSNKAANIDRNFNLIVAVLLFWAIFLGMRKPIFIIGYMGSGKTRLAKVLGESLNSDYFDLDDCISSSLGKNIDEIFEKEGELIFRKLEEEQLL